MDDSIGQQNLQILGLLASQILTNTQKPGKTSQWRGKTEDLVRAVSEVELRTTILGASTVTVTLSDPDWELQTSGLFTIEDGLISPLEINYPVGSLDFWRLCSVDGSTDLSQPNLTLTFENRVATFLRLHWGPKTWPPGTLSRPQAVFNLVTEVKAGGGIEFICPAMAKGLPEANTPVGTALTPKEQKLVDKALQNKSKGIGNGANITIGGLKPTSQQLADLNTALGIAESLKAGTTATVALIFAGIAETKFHRETNSLGFKGIWQSSAFDVNDVSGAASAFLSGGPSFQSGGAIALSRHVTDPVEIAVKVEVPSIWPDNAYAREAGYASFLPEAVKIVAAFGGGSLGSQDGSNNPITNSGQLSRGTTDNPDEDSWDCIQRWAGEVNWRAYIGDANQLVYADDPTLIAQRPAVYITRVGNRWKSTPTSGKGTLDTVASCSYTFDNSSLLYQDGAVIHGKHRRRVRYASPQTPSQVLLNMACGIDSYRAGQVVVFDNCGLINGRWIIEDATRRSLTENFTRFTLIPATAPTPEQKVVPGSTEPAQQNVSAGSPSGTTVPRADWNPDGKPIAKWIVPVLTWAAANGWTGVVLSGYRTAAEQMAAANHYAQQKGVPVSTIYPNGPLASNHCKSTYPGGAVDVTNPAQLNQVLKGYTSKQTLIWAGPIIDDNSHFSGNGH